MKWEDFTFEGSPIQRRLGFDEVERKIVVESFQPNLDECLEVNQAFLNADRASSSLWGGRSWVRVASIPLWLIEKWRVEEGLDWFDQNDLPKIIAKLNSGEYLKLRTAPGRI